ncbi:MAG: methyltransferase domain-containing protein [Candidatus Solibacter usitatus]|nr:methyltransferase domain-containing protein [Candidatus Solibacter usitatus]
MEWNASLYDQRHSFVWRSGEDLIALLDPQPGERILDAGCGTGQLTEKLAASGALVTGIDSSAAMLEQARIVCPQGAFVQADLLEFEGRGEFDGVFSNAVLHWIRPPERAAQRMYAALKPGGRLVIEMGGTGNAATLVGAVNAILAEEGQPAREPWYFPGIGEYSHVLEEAGFEVVYAMLFDRMTPLEGGEEGLDNWLKVFGGPLLDGEPQWRASALERVREAVRPRLFDPDSAAWRVDYRRLRIAARKPA